MNLHVISGLPRAGTTLLSSILSQNPTFHASISDPVYEMVCAAITAKERSPGYSVECPKDRMIRTLRWMVHGYYDAPVSHTCFNTNRCWMRSLNLLDEIWPEAKVIVCVRDIPTILNSFELLYNPMVKSTLYRENETTSVYSRTHALMSPDHVVRTAYDALKEGLASPHRSKLMLVEYDNLVAFPQEVLSDLYKFLDRPSFAHNFEDVAKSYDEYDAQVGVPNLHRLARRVEPQPTAVVLPPDLILAYSNLNCWRS